MENLKRILIVDGTYLGDNPNRERNVINVSFWIKKYGASLVILTSLAGIEFYNRLFRSELLQKITFVKLPWSRDFVPKGTIGIVFEYIKRVIGIFFPIFLFNSISTIKSCGTIYALTSIFPDVAISFLIKKKSRSSKLCVVFDNFVKKPSEREGNYFNNLIPYLSHKVSLFLMKSFDSIFVIMANEDNIRKVKEIFRKTNVKIIEDINGVDLELARVINSNRLKYDIFYIGRLHRDKGIFDLLEITSLIKKYLLEVKIGILGKTAPGEEEKIKEKISDLEIGKNVEFIDYVSNEEKYKLLKSSKSFGFFSYYESYPVAVLEAMACGLKIFAYNLDIFNYYPFNLADVETFPKGDYAEISQRIYNFIRSELYKEKKSIDLCLIDQTKSAELQYSNF